MARWKKIKERMKELEIISDPLDFIYYISPCFRVRKWKINSPTTVHSSWSSTSLKLLMAISTIILTVLTRYMKCCLIYFAINKLSSGAFN